MVCVGLRPSQTLLKTPTYKPLLAWHALLNIYGKGVLSGTRCHDEQIESVHLLPSAMTIRRSTQPGTDEYSARAGQQFADGALRLPTVLVIPYPFTIGLSRLSGSYAKKFKTIVSASYTTKFMGTVLT